MLSVEQQGTGSSSVLQLAVAAASCSCCRPRSGSYSGGIPTAGTIKCCIRLPHSGGCSCCRVMYTNWELGTSAAAAAAEEREIWLQLRVLLRLLLLRRYFFRQICEGLDYCHQHHIAHRDLKLANFLITTDKPMRWVVSYPAAACKLLLLHKRSPSRQCFLQQ